MRADEITTARELPSSVATPVIAETERYNGWNATPAYTTVTPAGLSVWSYGDWREATAADATWFLVELATWSDYSGSTVERSNYRTLLRDNPDVFVDVHGGYGTRALLLPAEMPASFRPDDDDETRAEFWQEILRTLAALEDYPLVDDEDLSRLEMELADEAWECYLSWDVRRALSDAGVSDETLDETTDETLRELFYTDTYARDYGPEAESAVSVYFPFFADTVAEIARRLGGVS